MLVLSLFLLVLPSLKAEVAGCYYYPETSEDFFCVDGVSDTAAKADCATFSDCNFNNYFTPGKSCSTISECKPVLCNVDCDTHPLALCQKLGQDKFSIPGEETDSCRLGCCAIQLPKPNKPLCPTYLMSSFECQSLASVKGLSHNFVDTAGVTVEDCLQKYCQAELNPGTISVKVLDSSGAEISADKITVDGIEYSTAEISISAGTHLVKAEKEKFLPRQEEVSVDPEETVPVIITLQELKAVSTLSGKVTSDGIPLEGVTIVVSGIVEEKDITEAGGKYEITNLPAEAFTVTAGIEGYASSQKKILLAEGQNNLDFELEQALESTVTGQVFIDNTPVPGVGIYLDGFLKGSTRKEGFFSIKLSIKEKEQHKLSVNFPEYISEERTFTIGQKETKDLGNIFLTKYIGECSADGEDKGKPVASLIAKAVPGEKKVQLSWQKPCLEVQGYTLIRKHGDESVGLGSLSAAAQSFLDTDNLQWEEEYSYEIWAEYSYGRADQAATDSIKLGNEICENKYNSEIRSFAQFCSSDNRKKIYSCNDDNVFGVIEDCSAWESEGEDFYCAPESSERATCKDAGICNLQNNYFGLFSTKKQCYGVTDLQLPLNAPNYCYYDFSQTSVDQCQSCTEVKDCFDYNSKEACQINNCLTAKCSWIDGASADPEILDYSLLLPDYNPDSLYTTPETGAGYCVQEDYKKDDKCSSCSSGGNLFENNYCMANVCSGLGACFSEQDLAKCNQCGEVPSKKANCYQYVAEQECGKVEKINGIFISSQDSCSWEKCSWKETSCFKDGNADGVDDCSSQSGKGKINACRLDVTPPITTLISEKLNLVSLVSSPLHFRASDQHEELTQSNNLKSLYYCLSSLEQSAIDSCTQDDNFVKVNYIKNNREEELDVNVGASLQEKVDGKNYLLKYFSEDEFLNQENTHETFVLIDNVPPDFKISNVSETIGKESALTIFLEEISERMECEFSLSQVLPFGETQIQKKGLQDLDKTVAFPGLKGAGYHLKVNCTDAQGNSQAKEDNFLFDLEPRIDIVNPLTDTIISSTQINFQATTDLQTSCTLRETSTNLVLADFLTTDGKSHQTKPLSGFKEGEYFGTYKIVCEELLTGEKYEDYFHFTIDFTPPTTQIILQENERKQEPSGNDWKASFIYGAEVDFACSAEGFACEKTYYCLGNTCSFRIDPGYEEFSGPFKINESSKICYYSTDVGNSPFPEITCGNIKVEGYGLTLVNPFPYEYLGETWGISKEAKFDLEFYSKIPTTECRFDFVPDFDYDDVPAFRILTPIRENTYQIKDFPESVGVSYDDQGGVRKIHVKCKDEYGKLSPEKIFNLEYDPTIPEITDAYAEPDPLLEGTKVKLFVNTDDKTICRYDEEGKDFATMRYSFPGEEDNILYIQHTDNYAVNNFVGLKKDFVLGTICKNGAEQYSSLENISFQVDYTQAGGILSIYPQGQFFNTQGVTLSLQTSKNAVCEYEDNNTKIAMDGAGGKSHTAQIKTPFEKYYSYPVKCRMGENTAENRFSFTIDRNKPKIDDIDDGNFSCGKEEIDVNVYTNEQNLSNYTYEVYDKGLSGSALSSYNSVSSSYNFSSGSTSGKGLIFSATVGINMPIKVPIKELNNTKEYKVRVMAIDAAGNVGDFKESNGFLVVSKNYSKCLEDVSAPEVLFEINDTASCRQVSVTMYCDDEVGCSSREYGTSSEKDACTADDYYTGQNLQFQEAAYICYNFEDATGKNETGTKLIDFPDKDGDGVLDGCDKCKDTPAGSIADNEGCADGEVSLSSSQKDTDKDGLPDEWEETYNKENCLLIPDKLDSNSDGTDDAAEDYDNDGTTNYKEYIFNTNPCSADEPLEQEEEKTKVSVLAAEPKGGNTTAWVFFIIGLLLILGGSGYLIYYYYYTPFGRQIITGKAVPKVSVGKPIVAIPSVKAASSKASWIESWRRARETKTKQRERQALFGEFDKGSKEIPHVKEVLSSKGPTINKLQDLANRYNDTKEYIKPGLRQEEKSIFAKLENIAKQTQQKDISEVVSTDEAKGIFDELKNIIKKRKSKV